MAQSVAPPFADDLTLTNVGAGMFGTSRITQMAMAPGPTSGTQYLYLSSNQNGIRRVTYDMATSTIIPNSLETVAGSIRGNGVGIHNGVVYATEPYESSASSSVDLSRVWRIEDMGFGARAAIVEGIPRQDHGVNHIQVIGDSLYVGIGVRTRNGAFQTFSGDAYGESAYGGSIGVIENLNNVAGTANSAGFYPANPTSAQYRNLIRGADPAGASPYTTTDDNKLRIHSSGTRNPFGLAVDGKDEVWFTVNFQRTENHEYARDNLTSAEGDEFGDDGFQDDVHDQLFRAVELADYGYRNSNWQDGNAAGNSEAIDNGFFQPENRAASFTFDNFVDPIAADEMDQLNPALDQDYDVNRPVGLGPSSSSNGLDFYKGNALPLQFHKDAFVARWNGVIADGGDVITYRDVVSVDIDTGEVNRIAAGFQNPLDVLEDGQGNLLIADWGGSVWLIKPANPVDAAHQFSWDSDDDGTWSDRLTWNADALAPDDRKSPDAWGTARYAVTIDRPGADPVVSLQQDVRVESVTLGDALAVAEGSVLTVQDQVDVLGDGRLEGRGGVYGLVQNSGTLAPGASDGGDGSDLVGTLSIGGAYRQTAGGMLQIDLGEASEGGQADRLAVDGPVELAGALNVSLLGDYDPELGDRFDVLTTLSTIDGQFDEQQLPELSVGKGWSVLYSTDAVSLLTTIPGDYNGDLQVEGADFLAWQRGDGSSTGLDAWSANFGASASDVLASKVPEPPTMGMLLIPAVAGLLLKLNRRKRRSVLATC